MDIGRKNQLELHYAQLNGRFANVLQFGARLFSPKSHMESTVSPSLYLQLVKAACVRSK